jgi:hypothetical protein
MYRAAYTPSKKEKGKRNKMNVFKITHSRNGNTVFISLRVGKNEHDTRQTGAFTLSPLEWEQFCFNLVNGWPESELIMEDTTLEESVS